MAIFDPLSSDDLQGTPTGGGYGLQNPATQMVVSPQQQQAQVAQQIAQQRLQLDNRATQLNNTVQGLTDDQARSMSGQLQQSRNALGAQYQNLTNQAQMANHIAQMQRPLAALPGQGTPQDISQAQTNRLSQVVPYGVAAQYLPTQGVGHFGVADQPQTSETLLQNPKFLATLQTNPQQAHAIFGAMTNQDLGQVLQQKQQIHESQINNAAKDIQDKISAGNLRYGDDGLPQVQEQNPITGMKVWKTVNNADPQKQLPPETAMQLLNPEALARSGQPITRKNTAALLMLTGLRMGLQGDDLHTFVMSHTQNQGRAMTAQSAQSQPQSAILQIQSPSQPSEMPTGQQDVESLVNTAQSIGQNIGNAGGILTNTMRGIGGSLQNRAMDLGNLTVRGQNLIRTLQDSNAKQIPYYQHKTAQQIFPQP